MHNRSKRFAGFLSALLVFLVLAPPQVRAQNAGTVRGTVTDPSASLVPGATIQISGNGVSRSVKSDGSGKFTVTVPPGTYSVRADAKGFVTFLQPALTVAAGQVTPLDMALQIAAEAQQVQVSADAAGQVNTDPSQNVGALVLKNEDLENLPDDPDDLQADLLALAGPAAGPNGAQFFVDGFSGGQLPPKSSIREIRINSNPFSSEFDRPGFGRIEILTKPGTDAYHGSASFNYGDRVLDTRNPFLTTAPPAYSTKMFSASIGGPLLSKKMSFFLDVSRRQINENNLINATVLDETNFTQMPFINAYPTPNRVWRINPRLDYQLNGTNTLVLRYEHSDSSSVSGVGGFSLPTQATKSNNKNNSVQITETMIVGTRAVVETRFQFRDSHQNQGANGNPNIPGVDVSSSFNSGGSPFLSNYNQNKGFELHEIVTTSQGSHAIKAGLRLRKDDVSSYSTSNFNGTYAFSLNAAQPVPQCLAAYANPTSFDLYRETQFLLNSKKLPIASVIAQGCGPTQFTQSSGTPLQKVSQFDLGVFVQDDWRFRPNLTISTGLRWETQTNIGDHRDIAPRVAIAWAPGAKKGQASKTVIRTGWGMFYDRVSENTTLQTLRFNGVSQLNYQLTSTNFPLNFYPNVPPVSSLAGGLQQQNLYRLDPTVQAPYMMQAAISVERALPGRTSLSVNIVNSRGLHTLRQRNINAPLPGTFGTAATPRGVIPFPTLGPLYQYETTGVYKQTQAIVNMSNRLNRRLTVSGYYALGFAHSNSNGLPMDQYNTALDYGRAQFDTRHRGYVGGTAQLPFKISMAPFVTINSGSPFNITTGGQYNGDGIFNARPALATSSSTRTRVTPFGTFDLSPAAGATLIPVNYAEGPGHFTVNLRLSRTWGFGEKASPNALQQDGGDGGGGGRGPRGGGDGGGGGGPRGGGGGGGRGGGGGGFGGGGGGGGGRGGAASGKKYSLSLSINARNALNHVNLGQPTGNLTSPTFGQSTNIGGGGGGGFGGGGSAAGNRRIEASLRLSF